MFFGKWRQLRRLTNILRPYTGRDALGPLAKGDPLTPDRAKLGEVELVCVIARVQNFESIVARLDLRELGGEMIKFYAAVAEAIMTEDGDINEFCGGTVVGHFNVLHKVEEARIVKSAMDVFRDSRAAFDPKLSAQIGVGICRGVAIAGMFGSTNRITHTAFGPSAICAGHLAKKSAAVNICEEFAEHFSRPEIPKEPWISIESHWKIEA
jgi:hypothetical protein